MVVDHYAYRLIIRFVQLSDHVDRMCWSRFKTAFRLTLFLSLSKTLFFHR